MYHYVSIIFFCEAQNIYDIKVEEDKERFGGSFLVHVFSTASCRTRAADLDILYREFVVIGHLSVSYTHLTLPTNREV